MSDDRSQQLEIRETEYGKTFTFSLSDADGALPTLDPDNDTYKFQVYKDEDDVDSYLLDTDDTDITADVDAGTLAYEVQDEDFEAESAGDYYARFKVNSLFTTEVKLVVRALYSRGE